MQVLCASRVGRGARGALWPLRASHTRRVPVDTRRTRNQPDSAGTRAAFRMGVNGGNQMRDTRRQLKYFQALTALFVAGGEALAEGARPGARRGRGGVPGRE